MRNLWIGTCVVVLAIWLASSLAAVACHKPPWIQIIGPSGGEDVTDGCEIIAEVLNSNVAATSVEFLVDGQVVGVDDAADEEGKFSLQWDASGVAAGEHIISARATLADQTILKDSDEVKVVISGGEE